jgi:hypothetical protein
VSCADASQSARSPTRQSTRQGSARSPQNPAIDTANGVPVRLGCPAARSVPVLPHWLADAGAIFPVRHLADALLVAYNPHTTGLGFAGPDLLIVAAWGVAGLLIALRTFS